MHYQVISVAVLLLSCTGGILSEPSIPLQCPTDWIQHEFACYWVVPNLMTWDTAERLCKSYGAHLAVPKDLFTNDNIGKVAHDAQLNESWTGADRQDLPSNDEVSLDTSTGDDITVAQGRWFYYQPEADTGECVSLRKNDEGDYRWTYRPCEFKAASICQRPVCPTDTFMCVNQNCVSHKSVCDGENDCGDGSDEKNCNERCSFNATEGLILHPDTGNYANDQACTWYIETPIGSNVMIQVQSLNLETDNDYISVLGGGLTIGASHEIARLTGSTSGGTYHSSNNLAIVQFFSDSSVALTGFIITYNSTNSGLSSRNHLTATNNPQDLYSPFYSEYQMGNQDYTFIITAENKIGPVTLQIVDLDLADDSEIIIRDGDMVFHPSLATLKATYKGSGFVVSSGKYMYIIMKNINGRTGGGAHFKFWQGCNYNLEASTGYITSPGYPVSNYPNTVKCSTTVTVPNNQKVTLVINDLDLNGFDTLNISSQGTMMKNLNGQSSTPIYQAVNNGQFVVDFESMFVGTARGFNISFSIDCPTPDLNTEASVTDLIRQTDHPLAAYHNRFRVKCTSGASFTSMEHLSKEEVLMECRGYGQWNVRTSPRCERIFCPLAPTVENGYVSQINGNLDIGSTITYECQSGFSLVGQHNVTCFANGTWSQAPQCTSTDCGTSPQVLNADKSVERVEGEFGSVVKYTCHDGYQVTSGSPIRHCTSQGWQGDVPTCSILTCTAPAEAHLTYNSARTVFFGQTITVTCNTGYTLHPSTGPFAMTCQSNREFDKMFKCQDEDECTLNKCAHDCVNTIGSYICSCRPGYLKTGDLCIDINECALETDDCDEVCNDNAGGYTCGCNTPGSVLFTHNGQEGHDLRTGETGQREGDMYLLNRTCVLKQCPVDPGTFPNADILGKQESYHVGDTVKYRCHLGFLSGGQSEITRICSPNGQWSSSNVDCVAVQCPVPNPPSLLNPGVVDTSDISIPFGSRITINCNRPGFGSFVRYRHCTLLNGHYVLDGSDEDHDCGFVDCGQPEQVPGSVYLALTATYYDSTFTFSCVTGTSQVSGKSENTQDSTVTCTEDGYWGFGDLSCPDVRCEDPGQPRLGRQIISDYRDGQLVTFECNFAGYELRPHNAISCRVSGNGNAQYNNTLPQCVDIEQPIIFNCPEQPISAPLFTPLGSIVPNLLFQDNGGIKKVSADPIWPTNNLVVSSSTQTFTITATDYAGNQETCTMIVEGKDITPPTFDCPQTMERTFSNDQPFTVNFDKTLLGSLRDDVTPTADLVVNFNPSEFTFEPTTMKGHSFPPVYDQAVTVTVTDEAGNINSCEFNLHFEADICHPNHVRTPPNSVKTCGRSGSGYSCTVTCNNGYVLYDDVNSSSATLTCPGPGSAFISRDIKCVFLGTSLEGHYRMIFSLRYQSNSTISTNCGYENMMKDVILNSGTDVLNNEECPNYDIDVIEADLDQNDNYLDFTVSIKYEYLPGRSYKLCSRLQETVIEFFHDYYKDAITLEPSNCPIISYFQSTKISEGFYCTEASEVLQTKDSRGYCLVCPEGTFKGTSSCEPCSVGTYNHNINQASCQPCGALTSTYETGSTSNTECYGLCSSGTKSLNGLPPCTNCPKNSYGVNGTYCAQCSPGTITRQTRSTFSSQCLPKCGAGFFNPIDGHGIGSDCIQCPRHFYSTSPGSISCIECADDEYTVSTGSISQSSCLKLSDSACQCSGHGSCEENTPHYTTCVCNDGWWGPNCNTPLEKCASNPCVNGGTCAPSASSYTCACPASTSGPNCEVIVTTCTNDYCQHNGMCENTITGPKCHCIDGSSGSRCERQTNQCDSFPCSNNFCQDYGNIRFVCHCSEGFSGKFCNESVDDCISSSCANNGTCVDIFKGHTCDCSSAQGYSGTSCEIRSIPCNGINCGAGECISDFVDQDYTCVCNENAILQNGICVERQFCDTSPCENGATCNEALDSCTCLPGYTGPVCQHKTDECAVFPCINGGTCIDQVLSYLCECPRGFTGINCDQAMNGCQPNLCNPNNIDGCINHNGDYECVCKPGFTGIHCETDIDECASSPCLHQGVCEDQVNDYACNCANGWVGKSCESVETFCSSSKCQNEAACLDVFGNYFCECLPNTHGPNCENSVDVCLVTSPCLRGDCGDTDGDGEVECTCPFGISGDRCQSVSDFCQLDDTCLNGGMCKPLLDGYSCVCPDGFTGPRCETDTDYCLSNNCPTNAQCIDMETRAYCRCPLKMDGATCNKDWDPNWDFFFHHSTGLGCAYVPYPIELDSSKFSISMWLQFSENDGEGTFFSLYICPRANSLKDKKPFVRIDESKLTVYINGEEKIVEHRQKYNDGQWHYLVAVVDGDAGQISFILDTVRSDPVYFTSGTIFDYNICPELGCHLDTSTDQYVMEKGFNGKLTRVSIYSSALDFLEVSTTGNENVDAIFPNAILLWAEYEHTSGVDRLSPSAADTGCPLGFTNSPACDQTLPGKNIVTPVFGSCPADIIQTSPQRLQTVSWDTPSFSGGATVKQSLNSDDVFIWGRYPAIIEARNDDGNAALCLFHIYLQDEVCTQPQDPPNVDNMFFRKEGDYSRASANCPAGYAPSIPIPKVYTCDQTGDWNPLEPFLPLRIPPCGRTHMAINNLEIDLNFMIPSIECDSVTPTLITEIRETLVTINNLWDSVCKRSDCTDADVTVDCSNTPDNTILTGKIKLLNVSEEVADRNAPTRKANMQNVFQSLILAENNKLFDYQQNVFGAVPKSHDFRMTQECDAPKVLLQGECVECGPGTYYDTSTEKCHFCPIGQFNQEPNQISCNSCGSTTTAQVGASNADECKAKCEKGHYFDTDMNDCQPCKRGFYQPDEGQFFCYPCSAQTTTRDVGTISESSCANICQSGSQIGENNVCEPCPIGFFRKTEPICEMCPDPFVTESNGTKTADQCTVANNPSGTFRTGADHSEFELCPIGSYQPEKWQTECISCGENFMTENAGSVNVNQCIYVCPSGKEKIENENSCRDCPIGTYRDGLDFFESCQACSSGFVTIKEGATKQNDCSLYGCGVGQQPNVNNDGCDACPKGSYQPENNKDGCIQCANGESTNETESKTQSDCKNYCESGHQRLEDGTCEKCPQGTFKDNSEDLLGMCQACPNPLYNTSGNGATSLNDCSVLNCDPGEYGDIDVQVCKPCPLGQYQDESLETECKSCIADYFTRAEGATKEEDCERFCPSGKEKIGNSCSSCERGYFKDNNEDKFMVCKECPSGFITDDIGATSSGQCNVGNCTAGQKTEGSTCTPCPKDYYQDEKWQKECKYCGEDRTTPSTGSTDVSQCFLNCPQGEENRPDFGICTECEIGYYKDKVGPESCDPCDDLKKNGIRISKTRGAISRIDCLQLVCIPGFYPTGGECKECEYGFYQDTKWEDQCKQCGDNRTTYVMGANSSDDCLRDCGKGEAYNLADDSCSPCPIGEYNEDMDPAKYSCTPCNPGQITATTGSISQSACTVSDCSEPGTFLHVDSNSCRDCPIGEYQDIPRQTQCTQCAKGLSTRQIKSPNSTFCKDICIRLDGTPPICAENETCDVSGTGTECSCIGNFVNETGSCIHKCDYHNCGENGECNRDDATCTCSNGHTGERCENRPSAASLFSSKKEETLIIAICVCGFVLLLILLCVALFTRARKKNSEDKFMNKADSRDGMKGEDSIYPPSNSIYGSQSPDPAIYQC